MWLFGSAARGEGGPDSDIDLLAARADDVDVDDPAWAAQVGDLGGQIWRWSVDCAPIAVRLAGPQPGTMLRRQARRRWRWRRHAGTWPAVEFLEAAEVVRGSTTSGRSGR